MCSASLALQVCNYCGKSWKACNRRETDGNNSRRNEKNDRSNKKSECEVHGCQDQVHLPAHKLAKELLNKGCIGKIFMARVLSAVYDMPEDDKGWKLDPKNKGVLLDMAVHYFMTLQWLIGPI